MSTTQREKLHLIVLLLVGLFVAVSCDNKFVSISVTSSWPAAPLHVEISEFIYEEEPKVFWQYLEQLGTVLLSGGSEKVQYEKALAVASTLLQPSQLQLLKFGVNLRYFSPRVEMFRQLSTMFQETLTVDQQQRVRSCTAGFIFQTVQLLAQLKKCGTL